MSTAAPDSTPADSPGGTRFPLTVRAAWDETPTLRGLRLSGPPELYGQYHAPGQYLELAYAEHSSGYFALAAAPPSREAGAPPPGELELLVRHGPGLAGALVSLPLAGELCTFGVRGSGFPLAAQLGRDLLLVAVGSGIAPLRAVLQQLRRQRRDYGQIALYYGERDAAGVAYQSELLALRAEDIEVTLVLTRPPTAWTGGVGYVQSHLRRHPPRWLGPGTAALLCGQSAMVRDVTAMLSEHDVPASQILLNY